MFGISDNHKENKNCKPNFPEYALWSVLTLGLLIKCVYFQFTTGVSKEPYLDDLNINMVLSLLSVLVIILGTVLFFFNRNRLTALLAINVAISLLLASDTVYFRYFYNPLTVSSLYQIRLIGSVVNSAASLIKAGDLIFVSDFLLLLLSVPIIKCSFSFRIKKMRRSIKLPSAVIMLAAGIALLALAYEKSSPGAFAYDNNCVVNNLGILYFHCYDTYRYINENLLSDRTLDHDERLVLESFFGDSSSLAGISSSGDSSPENCILGDSSLKLPLRDSSSDCSFPGFSGESSQKKHYGAAKGMNLIIVQLEAIQNFVIGLNFNGKEVTPILNEFINDSVYLDNFYYQVGDGNTSDAEFLVNNSLFPLKSGSVYFRYPNNTYRSLPKLLKEQGYTSYVFHANNPSFWNRTDMYRSMGFDHFISCRDFDMDEYLGWSLSDISFFRQSLDKINAATPFYGFFITLTSHHPYNYFDNYNKFDAGAFEGTMAGNYAEAAHYVDTAVGNFLSDLKSRGLFDNSVIVIYGDHHAVPRDQTDMLADLINFRFSEYRWTNLQRAPCFIRYPGMDKDEKGVNSTICGQIDLLPTIANLMGFDSPYSLGKDIFNTENGYAVLRDGSVITDDFTYTASNGMVYDNDGQELDSGLYADKIKRYGRILEVSDIILEKNAFGSYGLTNIEK